MENKTESERESDMGKTGSKQTKLDGTDKRTYATRRDVSDKVKENRGNSSMLIIISQGCNLLKLSGLGISENRDRK